jgi:hypothetical protein
MGLGRIHKQKFKIKSTYTMKKRRRLMQVKWKWCGGLSRDNLKHKLYMACNLWEEALLPSLLYTLCLSMGTTSKCHFLLRPPNGNPKIGTFVVPKLWTFIYFSNQIFKKSKGNFLEPLKRSFQRCITCPNYTSFDPAFKGFMVESQISNLTLAPSFDHISCKSGLNEQCKLTLTIFISRPF